MGPPAPAPGAGAPPAAFGPATVKISRQEMKSGLYNKVVFVHDRFDERGRPKLYFVLLYNQETKLVTLVEMVQDGHFGPRSARKGRPRWKLTPEGLGEELQDFPASQCVAVPSEAVNKLSDADKESWEILHPDWET